jgi:hypothetical protein
MMSHAVLYNMALATLTKEAIDPGTLALLAKALPVLLGAGAGAAQAGPGRRLLGATLGGGLGGLGAHLGGLAAAGPGHEALLSHAMAQQGLNPLTQAFAGPILQHTGAPILEGPLAGLTTKHVAEALGAGAGGLFGGLGVGREAAGVIKARGDRGEREERG